MPCDSLQALFAPRSVALIGASERPDSVGSTLLSNLTQHGYRGAVSLVNPRHLELRGQRCFPKISDAPGPIDLAVIATPAITVSGVIGECAEAGVAAAVIISAGFRETGASGLALEQEVLKNARRGGIRIVGPNCLGVMNPHTGLNATFANAMARPGNVGFLSQSGALCTAILNWSLRELVGFSVFCSTGSMLDIAWGDLIDYLGDDPFTKSIVVYMESVGDASSFVSAAREVALKKPVIVLKAGRTEAAAKVAATHTGSLTGGDEVMDAVFRRCGVLRVNNISDIFYMTEVLANQPPPPGPRLLMVTNAGGPGVLATDTLLANEGELAELSTQTLNALNEFLPVHWSGCNPIDMLGDADPERFRRTVEIAAGEPQSDGLLIIMAPQGVNASAPVAEAVKPFGKLPGRPVLASWMGGASADAGVEILNRAGIPTFSFPDSAARAFAYLWQYSQNLRLLYETPALIEDPSDSEPDSSKVQSLIEAARYKGRTLLAESESKAILKCYGLPVVETQVADDEAHAVALAAQIGYPVVLKVHSGTITHKREIGGVRLNIRDEREVREAYCEIRNSIAQKVGSEHFAGVSVQPMIQADGVEIILGSMVDPLFGPVLLFGSGGQMVKICQDRALALPPLNATLARRMIERTKIWRALKSRNLRILEKLLVQFGRLVIEQRRIKEIEINPLLASSSGFIALDARIVLHDSSLADSAIPKPIIRPYPSRYSAPFILRNGTVVTIRPIKPEDEPLMVKFHATLSNQSVYLRYFHGMKLDARISHERLSQICFIDYKRQMALVVVCHDAATGDTAILGVARLYKSHRANDAECAFLVSDAVHHHGLGTELARRLIDVARQEGLGSLWASVLAENTGMQHIFNKFGFKRTGRDREVLTFNLNLSDVNEPE